MQVTFTGQTNPKVLVYCLAALAVSMFVEGFLVDTEVISRNTGNNIHVLLLVAIIVGALFWSY